MKVNRKGLTTLEVILILALIVVVIFGGIMWNRLSKLNTWAVATQTWLHDDLWQKFIINNTFNGGGNPDGNKPPEPPGGL